MKERNWESGLGQKLQILGKFKYPLAILLLGVVLVAWPTNTQSEQKSETAESTVTASSAAAGSDLEQLEQRLAALLSDMEGAGRVKVLLQYAAGPRTVYQTDSTQEVVDGEGETETAVTVETVLSGSEPVVVQTMEPTFLGAVVAAEGADRASVQLDLVNAVSSLTGLGADRITVIKLK